MEKLQNIGPIVAKQLEEIGINSYQSLKETGSKKAWQKLKTIDPSS